MFYDFCSKRIILHVFLQENILSLTHCWVHVIVWPKDVPISYITPISPFFSIQLFLIKALNLFSRYTEGFRVGIALGLLWII